MQLSGLVENITPVTAGHQEKLQYSDELHNSFYQMNPKIASTLQKLPFGDNRDELSKVSVPTLIIQSNPEVISQNEFGMFVYENLQNSISPQIEVPGHITHLANPGVTIATIRNQPHYASIS